jgi:O-antigen ligase/tetratricopeptide (TPR) repeat protein
MKGTIFAIFIFLLVFPPLAFGTVEPWSYTVMETLIFFSLVLFLCGRKGERDLAVHRVPGIVPLTIFLLYILLQLLPLPPGLLKLLSPGTYALYKETLWAASPHAWGPISLQRKATLAEFLRIASYAAFYLLTVQLLARKELLTKTVRTVAVFAAALAFFGMVQQFFWNGKLFWVRELTQGGIPYGPFVNRNHYAGLADMVLPLVLCLFIYYRPRYTYISRRDSIVAFFSHPMTNVHVLLGFAAVLIGTSVFLSLSRGGIISLCLSVVFLIGMKMNRNREGKGWILVVLVVVVVFYSVGWFGWDKVFQRFDSLRDSQGNISEMRAQIWEDSLGIMKDFPLTGTGFGSFMSIYPKYRTTPSEGIVDHAHNDYIELFCDGGIIAAALFGWFLYSVLRGAYAVFLTRRDRFSIYLFIGAVTGIVSILIHSLTDFNLHIGANGLYFFFLLGLAVSASHTRMRNGPEDTLLGKTKRFRPKLLALAALAVLAASAAFNTGVLAAKISVSRFKGEPANPKMSRTDLEAAKNAFHLATFFDPLEAEYRYRTANAEWFLSDRNSALGNYKKAVLLFPADGEYLQALGIALSGAGEDGMADLLFRSGVACDRENPLMYKRYASWLLSKGNRERAPDYLKSAIALEPDKTREYVTLLVLYGWNDSEIRTALPAMAGPRLLFADYLSKTGKKVLAAEEYRSAIGFAENEKETRASYFYQAYRYFMKTGMIDDALSVMRKGEELLPGDVGIKMALAEAYEKAGIPYRAAEEYRKVLVIDPDNRAARKKIAESE